MKVDRLAQAHSRSLRHEEDRAIAEADDGWPISDNHVASQGVGLATAGNVAASVSRAGLHCCADSIPRRDLLELTAHEGYRLIDQVRAIGSPPPLFVVTGGDPMRRRDLTEPFRYATEAGLTVALTPSGTAAVTRERLAELKDAGLPRVAVSLDGPRPETHDAFRRVRGSYTWTMRIIEAAIDLELPLQINSTISKLTLPYLEAMTAWVSELPIALWALFFLIRTGRGASLEQIPADECERVLNYLYALSLTAPFGIKTTEAPHYQRVVWQRDHERAARGIPTGTVARRRQLRAPRSVNDGNGFVFVDHTGNICPSGFLPVVRGNVRTAVLGEVYRTEDVFTRLRNANALAGKCGRCGFLRNPRWIPIPRSCRNRRGHGVRPVGAVTNRVQ
jgi:AdoMet-dependent heme synthase